MKKRTVSALCAFAFLLSLSAAAAEPRASDYFWYTDVYASAQSGGNILIEIEINATDIMQKVGATDVYIYEQQSDGGYDNVYTFTSDDYPSLMWTNNAFYDGAVAYEGTVGTKYYATVALYAKDANGSETMYEDTYVVTARA